MGRTVIACDGVMERAFRPGGDSDRALALEKLEALCSGRALGPSYFFCHEGKPTPKGRPRAGKGRRIYTPARTIKAENNLGFRFRAARVGDPLDGKIALVAIFFGGRGDSDNLLKLVMDAGTRAAAWGDDRQVIAHAAFVERPAAVPRTLVAWCEVASLSASSPAPVPPTSPRAA